MKTETPYKFYTAAEAAKLLHVHVETVRAAAREGRIPVVPGFRKIFIPVDFFKATKRKPWDDDDEDDD
jgi:excisionase family DNA binding protein